MKTSLSILFKSNDLIKTRHNLTVEENRVLEKIFLQVQKQKSNIILVSKEEIDKILSNKNYKTKEGFKEFFDRIVKNRVEIKQGGSWALIALLSSVFYQEKTNEYKIEVPVTLLNFMTEYAKKGYTPINVTKYVSINKSNAQRLYELLRMWTGSKKIIEYTVQELKEYLKLEDSYSLFKNFRIRVIEASVKELKEKELLDIYKVEYIKKGRSVNSIKFYVTDLEPRTYDFNKQENKIIDIEKFLSGNDEELSQNDIDLNKFLMENKDLIHKPYSLKERLELLEKDLQLAEMESIINIDILELFAEEYSIEILEKTIKKIVKKVVVYGEEIENPLRLIRDELKLFNYHVTAQKPKDNEGESNTLLAKLHLELINNAITRISQKKLEELEQKYTYQRLEEAVNIIIQNNTKNKVNAPVRYIMGVLENLKETNIKAGTTKNITKISNINSSKPSNFDNFTPREYDYNKLEKQLLGWDIEEADED